MTPRPDTKSPEAEADRRRLKEKIEQVLSEILSDKHECKIKIHFEKQ